MTPYEAEWERLNREAKAHMDSLPESERVKRLEGSVIIWREGCRALQQQCDKLTEEVRRLQVALEDAEGRAASAEGAANDYGHLCGEL